jgi:hypothetical protein
MAFHHTSWGWALAVGVGLAVVGCGGPVEADRSASAEEAAGRLHLPLVTPDEGVFRLAHAIFQINDRSGALVQTLNSDASPDATSLDAELGQAAYSIELIDGWALEQLAEDGTTLAVPAALLTTNPADFEIHDDLVTNILYEFATNDGVISFGAGGVSIGVSVTTQAGQPACDLLDRSSCPAGQSCLLRDGTSETFCADSGSLPVGAPCNSDQCVSGSQCLAVEGSAERACTRFCNPSSTFCGCRSLSFDESVGVCAPGQAISTSFIHDFSDLSSGAGSLACDEWNAFQSALTGGAFGRIAIQSSVGGEVECTEPEIASQICAALGSRSSINVACQGHTWNVGFCEDLEIAVDTFTCNCTFSPTVRPCDGSGNGFGGFSTNSCSNQPQTLGVVCE